MAEGGARQRGRRDIGQPDSGKKSEELLEEAACFARKEQDKEVAQCRSAGPEAFKVVIRENSARTRSKVRREGRGELTKQGEKVTGGIAVHVLSEGWGGRKMHSL